MFKRYIAPCKTGGWRFMTCTIVTLWKIPLQLNVDKRNSPSVRRVLRENRGSMASRKADDEAVFCVLRCFFVRRRPSDVRKSPAQAGLFR